MTAPTLRPYQRAQLDAVVHGLEQGVNRLLIKSPTGTGKTVMFSALPTWPGMATWLQQQGPQKGASMLVIAHREELLDQAAEKIQRANPGRMVSIEQGERRANRYSDIVIASIQTLSAMKFRRLHDLLRWHQPRVVIVDEAHHAAAASYRTALVHLGFLPQADASDSGEIEAADFDDVAKMEAALAGWDAVAPRDRVLVGVTATPNRSDAVGLGCVFQSLAYSYGLKQAISDGWLVPITPWVIETDASLDDVRTARGDFNQKDLAEAVNTAQRNQLALAAWEAHARGLPTLGFTVDVAHAHAAADVFRGAGHRAAAVSGETPKEDRRILLRQFSEGQIDQLFNCMVLTEGTDLPITQCILHLKPTKSATLYEQMTGRGLRLYPGKTACVVIDLVDIARRHSLQAAPVLYGLPPGLVTKGEDLGKTEAELDAFRQQYPSIEIDALTGRFTLADLRARATQVDLWTIPELGAFASVCTMPWIKLSPELFRLQYPWQDGTEVLSVQKDLLGQWEIVQTSRSARSERVTQRTLAKQVVSPEAALKLSEAYVVQERPSVTRITDRAAPWRQRPASPAQLSLLRRLKVPHGPTITSGQASDLINLAKARQGR